MIQPHWFNMYCFNCGKDDTVEYYEIEADKVIITLDLIRNQYIFEAYCPVCNKEIRLTRTAFGR